MKTRRILSAAARRTGLRVVPGHFDGLAGVELAGWVRGPAGSGSATLMFGDKVVMRTRSTTRRSDLVAAGIDGAGFVIAVATLTRMLETTLQGDVEPRSLHVVDSEGAILPPAGEPVSAIELQAMLAVGMAVNGLAAPVGDADSGHR